ncbi:MAG: hypothetical protein ACE5IR_26800 [bacterium]
MSREKKQATVMTFTVFILMIGMIWVGGLFARDLPLLLPLDSIGPEYDEHRVSVFGWVRSVEVKRGRMGSTYSEIILGKGESKLKVYTMTPENYILNKQVIVQGTYRESGRFGGFPVDKHIVSEVIVRDWGAVKE